MSQDVEQHQGLVYKIRHESHCPRSSVRNCVRTDRRPDDCFRKSSRQNHGNVVASFLQPLRHRLSGGKRFAARSSGCGWCASRFVGKPARCFCPEVLLWDPRNRSAIWCTRRMGSEDLGDVSLGRTHAITKRKGSSDPTLFMPSRHACRAPPFLTACGYTYWDWRARLNLSPYKIVTT
jgi:hypothetical protein